MIWLRCLMRVYFICYDTYQWTHLHLIYISLLWTIYQQVWAKCLTHGSNVFYIGTYSQIRMIFFYLPDICIYGMDGISLSYNSNFDMGDVYVMWLRSLWYGPDIARYMWDTVDFSLIWDIYRSIVIIHCLYISLSGLY